MIPEDLLLLTLIGFVVLSCSIKTCKRNRSVTRVVPAIPVPDLP